MLKFLDELKTKFNIFIVSQKLFNFFLGKDGEKRGSYVATP